MCAAYMALQRLMYGYECSPENPPGRESLSNLPSLRARRLPVFDSANPLQRARQPASACTPSQLRPASISGCWTQLCCGCRRLPSRPGSPGEA